MINMKHTKKILFSMIIVFIITLSGCSNVPQQQVITQGTYKEPSFQVNQKVEINSFSSVEELEEFISSTAYTSYNVGGMASRSEVADSAISAPVMESSKSLDFSETNVQVQGVDEADLIKTDGNYIYTITGNTLFVIKAYPGEEAEVLSTTYIENRPENIFITKDYVFVFGTLRNSRIYQDLNLNSQLQMSFFNVYSIEDKESLELVKEFKFDGRYFNARMYEDNIYFFTTTGSNNRMIQPLPIIIDGSERREMNVNKIFYYNTNYQSPQFVNIFSINTNSLENIDSISITSDYGQNLYMSKNNAYISYSERINEYDLMQLAIKQVIHPLISESDKLLIEKIKLTDNMVLSQAEKQQKIMQVYYSYLYILPQNEQREIEDKAEKIVMDKLKEIDYMEYTVINKIKLDNGFMKSVGSNKVPGYINNQFSMDEYEDVLRVATTIRATWSMFTNKRSLSVNNVYTLDKNMNLLGSLEGLAEDESIYSARYVKDRLYMVTFREIDPFFVIDLSDPRNPIDLGELKIPGFSRYLHPYDENTIIGIGQDATETGRIRGLKVSLFDVTDNYNPKEVTTFVTEEMYAYSTALFEHKAFLFSKDKNLLVIPAYNYDYMGESGYNGAFVFDISKDSITLRGLIDHSRGSSGRFYGVMVERSLYIEDLLYTKSPNLLRINSIDTLKGIKDIPLIETNTGIPVY